MKKIILSVTSCLMLGILVAQTDSARVIKSIKNDAQHNSSNTKPVTNPENTSTNNNPIMVPKKGHWVIGGNLGGSFGNQSNFVIAPQVGYRFNNGLELGANVGYNFYKDDQQNYEIQSNYFNLGPYALYNLASFYGKVEYQYLTGNQKIENEITGGDYKESISENALWLGAGYQNRISSGTYYRIGFMYNVLFDKDDSIYGSGFMPTIGVSFGL